MWEVDESAAVQLKSVAMLLNAELLQNLRITPFGGLGKDGRL
jgi:hypothetical protein